MIPWSYLAWIAFLAALVWAVVTAWQRAAADMFEESDDRDGRFE